MKNAFLTGKKVYLRPLELADAPILQGYMNDPEVRHTLARFLPVSLPNQEQWVKGLGQNDRDVTLGIALQSDDRLIGATGLHRIDYKDRKAEFGIAIGAKDEWNKGHGTDATALLVRYAFDELNLNRVALRVYEYNQRGVRCYEKAGFQKEGVLRQDQYKDGRYWDVYVMGILKEKARA